MSPAARVAQNALHSKDMGTGEPPEASPHNAGAPEADSQLLGHVIEQVNRKSVSDVSELRAAVKASGDKPALFLVTREGQSLYLTVEAPHA